MMWCYNSDVLLPVDALLMYLLLRVWVRGVVESVVTGIWYGRGGGNDYVKIVLSFCHFAIYAKWQAEWQTQTQQNQGFRGFFSCFVTLSFCHFVILRKMTKWFWHCLHVKKGSSGSFGTLVLYAKSKVPRRVPKKSLIYQGFWAFFCILVLWYSIFYKVVYKKIKK